MKNATWLLIRISDTDWRLRFSYLDETNTRRYRDLHYTRFIYALQAAQTLQVEIHNIRAYKETA